MQEKLEKTERKLVFKALCLNELNSFQLVKGDSTTGGGEESWIADDYVFGAPDPDSLDDEN